jgi:hypothetical protein
MAETMNGKVQRTVVRKVAPVKLNDADARKAYNAGCEEFNIGSPTDSQAAAEKGNRLILLAD